MMLAIGHILVFCSSVIMLGYSAKWLRKDGSSSGYIYIPSKSKKPEKPGIGTMDAILVIELILIIAYVVADFIVFYRVGAEPSTLTLSFFAVCGGENGFMAWIKTRKEAERFRRWEKEDKGEMDSYKEDKGL